MQEKKIDDRFLIQQPSHEQNFLTTKMALRPPRFAFGPDKLTINSLYNDSVGREQ